MLKVLILVIMFLFNLIPSFSKPQKEQTSEKVFVMVSKGLHPYFEKCYEGFYDAGKKYNTSVELINPPKFDVYLQQIIINDLIKRNVNGIALSAVGDKELDTVIQKAVNAGIPIITFDAPAPSTEAKTYIGTDNYKAGYIAGQKFIKLLDDNAEIALIQGGLTTPNLNMRRFGMEKAINDSDKNIKICSIIDNNGDYSIAVREIELLLTKYPNLKGIFGISAYGAPAAYVVVKQKNINNIVIGGFDDLKDTLKGIQEDIIEFCVVQHTYKMGWLSLKSLYEIKNGKKVPDYVDTGIIFVDKQNLSSYSINMKKELIVLNKNKN